MQTIAALNPDILCVQEALRFQMDAIRSEFPQYREWGGARDDGHTSGEYSSVFYLQKRFQVDDGRSSTFWLSPTPNVPSKGWQASCLRICTCVLLTDRVSGCRFAVANTHLDHVSAMARKEGINLILQHLGGINIPSILTGDFNCVPTDDPAILPTKVAKMQNCYARSHPSYGSKPAGHGTFHDFTGTRDGEPIDYVFASHEWEVVRSYVDHTAFDGGRRYPSDHFPVVAELVLQQNGSAR